MRKSNATMAWVLGVLVLAAPALRAECKVTETKRLFEGAEHKIVTLENSRIIVEVVPEVGGKIIRYELKDKKQKLFSWLDDCPYHYMCRWEGVPFTYKVGSKGPDKASVTVMGGGKIAVAHLRGILGVNLTNPIDVGVERTMSIDPDSTRLNVAVKITNTGDGVAPEFRYMVHVVYEFVAPAHWFIPTPEAVEVYSEGRNDMWAAAGTPAGHPFNRFTGRRADKPRFDPLGWAALHTGSGYTYIYYDADKTDFMQYWYGGYGSMFTFEPHSKPVDLKPGDSAVFNFTLCYDAKDVVFKTKTTAFEPLTLVPETTPDSILPVKFSATTVRDGGEKVKAILEIKDPKGQVFLSKDFEADVTSFVFTPLKGEVKISADAVAGKYPWVLKDSADNKPLSTGIVEVVQADEMAKRRTERAVSDMKKKYEEKIAALSSENQGLHAGDKLWQDSLSMALDWDNPRSWPTCEPAGLQLSSRKDVVPLLGQWKGTEAMRITRLERVAVPAWPADADKIYAALGADRALVRDVVPDADGKGLVALVVDKAKNRVEVIRLGAAGVIGKFGKFSDKPGEADEALGVGARFLVVDKDGNIWVSTSAWGLTSAFKTNQDGSPSEESVIGAKGALKKFSPDGKFLGAISMLDVPMAATPAMADGTPVMLASYRNVSAYHGAQVREGVMVVRVADVKRATELKVPAGSLDLDEQGRLWVADVAGHVACYTFKGQKLFDVASSPAAAALDSQLPQGSSLPAVVRSDSKGTVWVLYTLQKKLAGIKADGSLVKDPAVVSPDAGSLWELIVTGAGPMVVGDKALWHP